MKKNGFTLVEVLAVLIILAILIALSIPAYITVLKEVRRDNYTSKVTEIETAANKYGEKIKDKVKLEGDKCYPVTVADLIKSGELLSESDKEDVIYNPTDNKPLLGNIKICYDTKEYKIVSFYIVEFDSNQIYHKKDKVTYNNQIYECAHDYPGKGLGIEAKYKIKEDDPEEKAKPYFVEITY